MVLPKQIGFASAAAILAALALAMAAAEADTRKPPATHTVHIEGMMFKPPVLEISPGDSVTWINDDILMHAVKSVDPENAWQSKDLPSHSTWTHTFDRGGRYICPYHPTMTGELVTPASKAKP